MKFSISKEGLVNQKELFNNDLSPQQYARVAVHAVLQEFGIPVEEESEMDDDSIELTIDK